MFELLWFLALFIYFLRSIAIPILFSVFIKQLLFFHYLFFCNNYYCYLVLIYNSHYYLTVTWIFVTRVNESCGIWYSVCIDDQFSWWIFLMEPPKLKNWIASHVWGKVWSNRSNVGQDYAIFQNILCCKHSFPCLLDIWFFD